MVVIAIATIMVTAVVVQQSSWNDSLSVSTQAYEMALMIRQAQIYGLGVRGNTAGAGDVFNTGYGVFFSSDDSSGFNHINQYIFFADIDGDGVYDAGDNIIETKTLTRGVVIDRFCGIKGTNSDRCSPGVGNVSFMHITFFRPEPKARIILWNSGHNPANNVSPPAKIFLKSPGGTYYYVKVDENGQISTGLGNSI